MKLHTSTLMMIAGFGTLCSAILTALSQLMAVAALFFVTSMLCFISGYNYKIAEAKKEEEENTKEK